MNKTSILLLVLHAISTVNSEESFDSVQCPAGVESSSSKVDLVQKGLKILVLQLPSWNSFRPMVKEQESTHLILILQQPHALISENPLSESCSIRTMQIVNSLKLIYTWKVISNSLMLLREKPLLILDTPLPTQLSTKSLLLRLIGVSPSQKSQRQLSKLQTKLLLLTQLHTNWENMYFLVECT